MRRWLALGAVLLLGAAATAVYLLTRLNDSLAANRAALASRASAALGVPVQFAAIAVSLRDGASLRLTDLRLGDDLLRAEAATVSLSLRAALRGELALRAVTIERPMLTLVRDAGGWNVAGLRPPPATIALPDTGSASGAPSARDTTWRLRLGALAVRDGRLRIVDRQRRPPASLTLTAVAARLGEWTPGQPLRLEASATLADAGDAPLAVTAVLAGGSARIERATADLFGGRATASGGCTPPAGAPPACQGELALRGVALGPLLALVDPGAGRRLDGRLDATLRGATSGDTLDALQRGLRADGTLRIADGVVHGLNLARSVLGAIPGFAGLVRVGSPTAALLGRDETRFEQLGATIRIADQRLASDDVALRTPDFTVTAAGTATFAGALRGRGTWRGSPPLVADLAGGLPLLGRLASRTQGAIAIPFTVGGTLADPTVAPDLGGLARGLGGEATAGVEALFGAGRRGLDDLFGR